MNSVLFRFIQVVCIIVGLLTLSIVGITQGDTSVQFNVYDTIGLQIPELTISPDDINRGEELLFTTQALRYSNGQIASGITCFLELTSPSNQSVVLASTTDASGICSYDTSESVGDQNIAVISGDVLNLNNTIGVGSGYVRYEYQNTNYPTNEAEYTVNDSLTLVIPDFSITPPQIFVNENLLLRAEQLRFSDGTIAIGVPCVLTITNPSGGQVVLRSTTNNTGICQYDTSRTIAEQGYTLLSGDVSSITGAVGTGTGGFTFEYDGIDYTTVSDTYEVIEEQVGLVIPVFEITPTELVVGENLLFTTQPLVFDNGDVAAGIACVLFITTPGGGLVVLESQTDQDGLCEYRTAGSLESQGWRIVSGDINSIVAPGSGSAYIEYNYNGATYNTNLDTYQVTTLEPTLITPVFSIDPSEILQGEEVRFTLQPVTLSDGTLGVGLVCRLIIIAPDNTKVTFGGVTDNQGECEYIAPSRAVSINSLQAVAQVSVESGDPDSLNTIEGGGVGYAEVVYNNSTALSNTDSYKVSGQGEEEGSQIPTPEEILDSITDLSRTGGGFSIAVITLGILAAISIVQVLRGLKKKE